MTGTGFLSGFYLRCIMAETALPEPFRRTRLGSIYLADSLAVMRGMEPDSVDLVVTSPPFGLIRKKEYGNVREQAYLDWFKSFAEGIRRVLKESGSLVIDIGGTWKPGRSVREPLSLQAADHALRGIRLPPGAGLLLVESFEASHAVWWLSKSEWPRASNRRVLQPYSPRMEALFANGYETPRPRPSGHDIGDKFSVDNSAYLRYCRDNGIRPHPARFPSDLPEYFIRMLTDPGDMVFDPFGGSCVTGEVAERLERRWVCSEIVEEYLRGAVGPLRWTA